MKRKTIFLFLMMSGGVLFLFLLLMIPRSAASIDGEKAQNFVQSMGDEVVSTISDPAKDTLQRKQELKEILDERFDTYSIGRFVLGPYWRGLTSSQQEEYLALYEDLVVSIYARRFSHYQGELFKVSGVIDMSRSSFIVKSKIIPKTGQDIFIEWRVRFKGGRYKIIDVSIGGVSMILTHKADFASTIQREGGKARVIIDHLRQKKNAEE